MFGLGLRQYGLWSFQMEGTKLATFLAFLHKNQHTQRIVLNFENWLPASVARKNQSF